MKGPQLSTEALGLPNVEKINRACSGRKLSRRPPLEWPFADDQQ